MKTFFIFTLLLLGTYTLSAQSDGCSAATVLGVSADCSSPAFGTTIGATETIPGCAGNADDDVWYQFTATSTAHQITVQPIAGMDPVVQLFSGDCASLVSLVCRDNGFDGDIEIINYSGLTIGQTYRIRVYHYFTGSGTGDFTICITEAPPAPVNDNCSGATPLTVNGSCTYTNSTTDGASQSLTGCAGTADDDVWFSFVATSSVQSVELVPVDNLDLVFQVYAGTCGNLNSIMCVDNTFTGGSESAQLVGLTPGVTYYIRAYDYYAGTTGDFDICITGNAAPTPTNDEPCDAIQLPNVTTACQYLEFTNVGATSTPIGLAPTPSSCIGGSGAAIGGYSASSADVWFAITVPASGNIHVTSKPNMGVGSITDGVMALYQGSCNALTQIVCSDDNDYPGSTHDLLPLISASGLVPGSTVYLRYWGFGTAQGTFGFCVTTATNDACADALYICDINGYSASTSAAYTPDRPSNMHGNNETSAGVNLTDGIDSGGPFGAAGPWGSGSPFIDVNIENNSWIQFTASATTATLDVSIYDCWIGNYPSGGIQMQIFEADNCTNFVPVSNFEESSTGFIITAVNLTVGNDYYLMVDGYAGDICNYTITAESGVQFPDIVDVAPICDGESVILTAPAGATSYEWEHNGATTQSVTVTPSTTLTYYCEVTGLCDYKQTLSVTVDVVPNPVVTIAQGDEISICDGASIDLTATGAATYVWSTAQTNATINVAPLVNTSYTVTGTLNGCSHDTIINVMINPNPTLDINPTPNDADCGGSNGSLIGATGGGTNPITYTWYDNSNNMVGNTADLNGIPAGIYFLEVEDANNCTSTFGGFTISNPGAPPAPTLSVDNNAPCNDGLAEITITNLDPSASYSWTGPNGFTSSNTVVTLTDMSAVEAGNYCVSATIAGCTGPTTCQLISLSPVPVVNIVVSDNDSTICLGSDFTMTASGGSSYSWTGPNGFTGNGSVQSFSNASGFSDGLYVVNVMDANGCAGVDSIQIQILPLPVLNLSTSGGSTTYCMNASATLSASGADAYNWSGPNGFTNVGSNVSIFNMTEVSEGYYIVTGTDSEGCISSDSIYLSVAMHPTANAPLDTTICPGTTFILTGNGGSSYVWTGPGGFYSEDQNALVSNNMSFTESGEYVLLLIDENGCSGSDTTHVEVANGKDCLFIPNLITPNFDGLNDTWEISGIENYPNAEVQIFNRWGNLIYSSSPYNNDWDGMVNEGATIEGKDGKVPVGTYFYIVQLNEDNIPPFKGYLEVEY